MLFEIFINQKAMAIKSFKPLKIHVALKTKEKGQKQQKTENVTVYNEWKGEKNLILDRKNVWL